MIAELWRAKRACEAPWVSKFTHPRKFGNHVTVHRPPAARPSAPQAYQCLLSHFLAALGAQEKAYCTSIRGGGGDELVNRSYRDRAADDLGHRDVTRNLSREL